MNHLIYYSMKMKSFAPVFAALLLCAACSTEEKSPIDYVNPFVGTGFHGHTYPGATVPFGAVQLSPDTRRGNWDACAGYHYDDSTLKGFSHTHLSGTGCLDLGDILLRPSTQTLILTADSLCPAAHFSHADEQATPGYYAVKLRDEGIQVELTATTHVGLHRYTFPKNSLRQVIVDMAHLLDNEYIYEATIKRTAPNELEGMRCTRGWTDNQYVYFVARFSQPIAQMDTVANRQAIVSFDRQRNEPLIVKVALSVVSCDNARANMDAETSNFDFDFDAAHAAARQAWNQALGKITVEGGRREEMTNFYTALYHAQVVPNQVNDVNGDYRRHDMQIARLAQGDKRYSTFSLWDTFRAWHPLMTLIDTTLVNEMVNSLLDMYDATGELPIWPLSAGETGTMIGYHAVSVIADAYLKGIRGFDAHRALEAMKVSSDKNKKGSDLYLSLGYIPSNYKRESVSCLLEYAYDDWCIARMAQALGEAETAERYYQRAQSYINVFDGNTRFFRGKRSDGNWDAPFNSFEVGRAYTEATAWQYRFFVPHDVNGMVQLFGGREAFIAAVDSIFTVDSRVDGELSDITGLIGQYAHGNEPSHHIAYLYDYVAQPWKTQEMTRHLLQEMYQPTPEGICGNEDCGQMSAWYLLSSLGLYAVCPGSNEMALTTPLFPKATIQLANGKSLTITANNPARNHYIRRVELNGQEITRNFITYEELMQGGNLTFTLSAQPDLNRGTSPEAAPYSYTTEQVISIPYVNKDLNLFTEPLEVTLASATEGACIYYTLDGSEPTEASTSYTTPLTIDRTLQLKAKAFKEGFRPSRTLAIQATKAELKSAKQVVPTQQGTAYTYYEGVFSKVADIEKSPVVQRGVMAEPSLEKAMKEDHYAYIFTGWLKVPEDGVYGFMTASDDGSVLLIDGDMVVNNDGSHAAIPATGTIALQQGFHSYRLLYFEDYEGQELKWGWKLPSASQFAPIPKENLFCNE